MSDEFGGCGGDMHGFNPFPDPPAPELTVLRSERKQGFGRGDNGFHHHLTLKIGDRFIIVVVPEEEYHTFKTLKEAEEYPTGLNFIFGGHYE